MHANDESNSSRMLLKSVKCPDCKHKGIYYLGRDVLHGNPSTPASDTDVDLHYGCPACKITWTENA